MARSTTRTKERPLYVVARNAGGRATLMHKLPPGVASETACGYDIGAWSRAYLDKPIEEILCRKTACRS